MHIVSHLNVNAYFRDETSVAGTVSAYSWYAATTGPLKGPDPFVGMSQVPQVKNLKTGWRKTQEIQHKRIYFQLIFNFLLPHYAEHQESRQSTKYNHLQSDRDNTTCCES